MKMKKLLSLLLVTVLAFTLAFTLVSCGGDDSEDTPATDNTPKSIYELFEEMKPTRTVTHVTYKIGEDVLEGLYDMQIEGKNSIFTFYYDKYRTSSEAIEDNDSSTIKRVTGTVYCKDGKYSGDGVNWGASPVATEIKMNMSSELFNVAVVSKDGRTLSAIVSADKAKDVFGTELAADDNGITLVMSSNGTYVTRLTVTYKTIEGAEVKIETSYSYNALSLTFPN